MSTGAVVAAVLAVGLILFVLGLLAHAAIRDWREEAEKLRRRMAMNDYVDEVERAMRENKRLTDPEAVRRFHDALDAGRDHRGK